MKRINNKSKIIKILLVTIIIFYFIFLYMDLFKIYTFISSNMIKFSSMILVLSICLMIGENSISTRDTALMKIGLFITIIADIFLLLLGNHYTLGIGLFSIVQILYSIRYRVENTKNIIRNFTIIFIILFLIYIVIN